MKVAVILRNGECYNASFLCCPHCSNTQEDTTELDVHENWNEFQCEECEKYFWFRMYIRFDSTKEPV